MRSLNLAIYLKVNFRNVIPLGITFLMTFATLMEAWSQSDQIHFGQLSVEDGLSQSNVTDLYQDHLGFMWIGTEDGLNKYDGNSFTVYRNNTRDSLSISNNHIKCIIEDEQGNLLIGTNGGINVYNRALDHFEPFCFNTSSEESIGFSHIRSIHIDSQKNVWVGTDNGLHQYNPDGKSLAVFINKNGDTNSLAHNSVMKIFEDSKKRLWIATGSGLSLLNSNGKTFTNFYSGSNKSYSLSSNQITDIYEDRSGTLWVGTLNGGLNKMERDGTFRHFGHDEDFSGSISNNYVRSISEDHAGNLWIATDRGLDRFNHNTNDFDHYLRHHNEEKGLTGNSVTKILFGSNGRMWVGTRFGGIKVYDKRSYPFSNFSYQSHDKHSLNHNTVSDFLEARNGNFWIATDGGGLNYYERQSDRFTSFANKFTNNKVLAIESDPRGGVWVGMWQGGLNYFDPVTGLVKTYVHDPANANSLSDDNVFHIMRDSKDNIWVATWGNGISKYNRKTDDFTRYTHDPTNPNSISGQGIDILFEDSKGMIWVGTEVNGLDRLDPATGAFTHFKKTNRRGSISNNYVTAIYEDAQKRLWIGTNGGGLNLFHPDTQTFTAYNQVDGLPNNAIVGIQEDDHGNLWLSTNNGLSCFNPQAKTFKNFTQADGLQGNQFNRWASHKLATGEFLFGGTNGFTLFHPDSIRPNKDKPRVYITGFKVSNKTVKPGSGEILKKNITLTSEINLSYEQNIFSFEFAALNYLQPTKNQYKYKMVGFDKEWVDAGIERKASYTNLNPGKYEFRVIAANNDGVWNNEGAAITVIIHPPFWKTWWFITITSLAFAGSIFGFVMIRINVAKRLRIKLEEKIKHRTAQVTLQKERLEIQAMDLKTLNEQLQGQTNYLQQLNGELKSQREEAEKARQEAEQATRAKSVFLATMSHEIRTPMNGVLGMAALLAETELSDEQREYTHTIQSSGETLLGVINDILDFSKIESEKMELENKEFNLRDCIEEVMDVFAARAAQSGLDLIYELEWDVPSQITGDSLRLRQILINLVSNAVKFTHHGEVFLGVKLVKPIGHDVMIQFEVRDTGIGIPADKQERLFKPFSQVDCTTTRKYGGTGLGLAISQKLIALMGGNIRVQSEPGCGTSFIFTIRTIAGVQATKTYVHVNTSGIEGKRVLIVDDNQTNLTILRKQLEHWKLIPVSANTPDEALKMFAASPDKFDLVVTDMLMPDMDGIGLAQCIRSVNQTIPILLLTSVGDERAKMHVNLFNGTLTKPVKQQVLRNHLICQLLDQRTDIRETLAENKKLSDTFSHNHPLSILVAEDNPVNQKLAEKVLSKLGFEPDMVMNGFEVLGALSQKHYDVILMDVQMPGMDGLEATRRIRAQKTNQPAIIAMTANAMQGDRDLCLKEGMDDYICKPIRFEDLVSLLSKWSQSPKSNRMAS